MVNICYIHNYNPCQSIFLNLCLIVMMNERKLLQLFNFSTREGNSSIQGSQSVTAENKVIQCWTLNKLRSLDEI